MSISEPPTTTGSLAIHAPNAGIKVLDAFLQPVENGSGTDELTLELPPGAYRVVARIGARETSETVLVRAGAEPREVRLAPEFDAAAPVHSSVTSNETHGELAHQLTTGPPARARLIVILRGLKGRPMAPLDPSDPAVTPAITDALGIPLTLPVPAEDPHYRNKRALGWAVDVEPGGCRVRWRGADDAQQVEHALWVPEGHQTLVFVPQSPAGPVPAGASVHILPVGVAWQAWDEGATAVEATVARLRSRSTKVRSDVWKRVLDDSSAPPMLTLLTLHEMVRAVGADVPDELMRDVVRALDDLRSRFGESPDVVALEATLEVGAPSSVTWPPMLKAAHDLLVQAARSRSLLAPGSLAELVTGQVYTSAPWHLYDPEGLEPVSTTGASRAVTRGPAQVVPPVLPQLPTGGALGAPPGVPGAGAGAYGPGLEAGASTPPPVAVERVRQMLEAIDAAPPGAGPSDSAEVAERLGMAPTLAQRCIDELRS